MCVCNNELSKYVLAYYTTQNNRGPLYLNYLY